MEHINLISIPYIDTSIKASWKCGITPDSRNFLFRMKGEQNVEGAAGQMRKLFICIN